jgi:hypothetical protein
VRKISPFLRVFPKRVSSVFHSTTLSEMAKVVRGRYDLAEDELDGIVN